MTSFARRLRGDVLAHCAPALAILAAGLLRLLGATWRIEEHGTSPLDDPGGTQIGAIWHRDVLVAAWFFRDRGFTIPISRSRDGDLGTALAARLGHAPPPRGSSSRGGPTALRGLVRLVEDDVPVAIPVDGPRGPARVPKPGIVTLSRLTGIAVTPVAFAARPGFRFRSWDETRLPLPFARVAVRYGPPLTIASTATREDEERALRTLDRDFNALTNELDAAIERGHR